MIMDKRTEFCDGTALNTGAAGGYLIGNQIDMGQTVPGDPARAHNMWLVVQVDTAVDSAGDGVTVAFELRSDAAAAINADTGTLHFSSGAIAQASLTAGAQFAWQLPIEGNVYERYLGLVQRTAVEAVTAGAVSAFLTMDPPTTIKSYPDAVN